MTCSMIWVISPKTAVIERLQMTNEVEIIGKAKSDYFTTKGK